jgi:putative transcriptional regulator
MKCSYCRAKMIKRRATSEKPYFYKRSGLDNVVLSGIDVLVCPQCERETPIIPKVGQLHALLADTIVRQPSPLRGDEVRFLRKHAGLPAQRFAALIGVTPQHLSRIENSHTPLGKSADRLVRAFTLTATEGQEARTILIGIAAELAHQKTHAQRRPTNKISAALVKRGWKTFRKAS